MHSSIIVTKPAPDISLITLYEAKVSLKLDATSTAEDESLKFMILRASDEVGVLCSRVFAKESVIETFREIVNPISRLYLSRYPVKPADIVSIEIDEDALDPIDYDIDPETGKLTLPGGTWAEDIVVTYSGGYEVPQEVPPALRQAVILLTREAYYTTQRGDASVRSISHKESRIIYFDPATQMKAAAAAGGGGGGGAAGGTAAQKAAQSLLQRYTRLTA
jgi:hypothetical protein